MSAENRNRARCIVCSPGRQVRLGVWLCKRHWRLVQAALRLALYYGKNPNGGELLGDEYVRAVARVADRAEKSGAQLVESQRVLALEEGKRRDA